MVLDEYEEDVRLLARIGVDADVCAGKPPSAAHASGSV